MFQEPVYQSESLKRGPQGRASREGLKRGPQERAEMRAQEYA